jgi:hypothetical protein
MQQIMMLLRRVGVWSYSPVLRNSCTRSTIGVTLAVAEEHVVGLRPGARELVIDQGVALAAGRGQPVIGPVVLGGLFGLRYIVNEAVDHLAIMVAALAAYQRCGRHVLVARDHDGRSIEQCRHLQGEGGLAGTRRSPEVDRESRVEIGERTPGDRFDILRLHEVGTPPRRQRDGNTCVLRRRDDRHLVNSAKAAHACAPMSAFRSTQRGLALRGPSP